MKTLKDIFTKFELSLVDEKYLDTDIQKLKIFQLQIIATQTGINPWHLIDRILKAK